MQNILKSVDEPRKTAIMASAKGLFLNHGIEHTSISMISKDVGITKSLFYYYFANKEELVSTIIEEICEDHRRFLEKRNEREAHDIFDGLLLLVDSFFNFHPTTKQLTYGGFANEIDFNIRYHTVFLEKISVFIENIVKQANEEGYIFIEYPVETFIMMLEGLLRLHHDEQIDLTMIKMARIMEQTLHLPKDSMVEKARIHLQNMEKEVG